MPKLAMKRVANRACDALVATRSSIVRTCADGDGWIRRRDGALNPAYRRRRIERLAHSCGGQFRDRQWWARRPDSSAPATIDRGRGRLRPENTTYDARLGAPRRSSYRKLALAEPSLPGLDTIGVDYRRMYFIRRSIATVREFAEALPALDSCAGFHSIKNRLNETERAMWDKSVRFFRRNYVYIQKIRSDFGGHFGYSPAWHAVENLQETVAVLEYKHSSVGRRIQIRLKFAGEVVAIGMGHHKRGDTSKDHFRLMFRLALAAVAHSTRCVELLTLIYFEPRIRNVRQRCMRKHRPRDPWVYAVLKEGRSWV